MNKKILSLLVISSIVLTSCGLSEIIDFDKIGNKSLYNDSILDESETKRLDHAKEYNFEVVNTNYYIKDNVVYLLAEIKNNSENTLFVDLDDLIFELEDDENHRLEVFGDSDDFTKYNTYSNYYILPNSTGYVTVSSKYKNKISEATKIKCFPYVSIFDKEFSTYVAEVSDVNYSIDDHSFDGNLNVYLTGEMSTNSPSDSTTSILQDLSLSDVISAGLYNKDNELLAILDARVANFSDSNFNILCDIPYNTLVDFNNVDHINCTIQKMDSGLINKGDKLLEDIDKALNS